ncbi:MAG: 50S ribosomal protein L10 [Candidatus Aenigmarchaeota archaeon]|nr:50S ribosomal protein L10 [Candidatus Aenigmarchaeota archaeon]
MEKRKSIVKKERELEELVRLIKAYSVVGILNMHKMPARQLQKIRDSLRGAAVMKMSKKNLLVRAFEKSGLENLKEKLSGEPALLLTNENPFRLYKLLKESRSPAPAKAGDVASKDIVVAKGPTPIAPGPAISTLQKVGLKTSVQAGKIAVMQDRAVAKAGETITDDMVNVFNMLKMEPMEIGLDLLVARQDGVMYEKSVLDVDVSSYINELAAGAQKAVNLSVNTGYPTKLTIELIIRKAFSEARTLCVEANIIEKQFIDDVLLKAVRESMALQQKTGG